jgi:hypothetical protein
VRAQESCRCVSCWLGQNPKALRSSSEPPRGSR